MAVAKRGGLKAHIVIEAIHDDKKKTESLEKGEDVEILSSEQFMSITVELPRNEEHVEHVERDHSGTTHIIIVGDCSGSMAGNPIRQLQDAVTQVLEDSYSQLNRKVSLITYSKEAKIQKIDAFNYKKVIGDLKAGGMTSFTAAFNAVNKQMDLITDATITSTVIVFMTDGSDTVEARRDHLMVALTKLSTHLKSYTFPVTVHTVGFTADHDYEFMSKITQAGTEAGMYRYCEPNDGKDALKLKLDELFQHVVGQSVDEKMDIEVSLSGNDKVIDNGKLLGTIILSGTVRSINKDHVEQETAASAPDTKQVLEVETWIYVEESNIMPKVGIVIHPSKGYNTQYMKCSIGSINQVVVKENKDKVLWSVRILSRNTDFLTTTVGKAISSGKADVSKLSERLKRLQERIAKTRVYGQGITKDMRADLFDMIQDAQNKVDLMHSMLADYTRGKSQSVQLLARANDLRYAAVFTKNRRQRMMNMRASKNLAHAQKAQDALNSLVLRVSELDGLSTEAMEFFFCILSQNNIKEVLFEEQDKTDAIGFGLAVERPEHVLDEPTAIVIHKISGTLVSRSAIMDAVKHRIDVDGHLSTHGGFTFGLPLGVATVGASREPINSWLPLYVCEQHWNRVKVLMKPILGYFCTLDDLGYDYKQVDAMFMVLGSMIAELSREECGEHQLRLLAAFHRTCAAVAEEFGLTTQMIDLVRNFIKSADGRTRDVVPNLYSLIGYVVSLPTYALKVLFTKEKKDGSYNMAEFWLAFLSENLRRATKKGFRATSDSTFLGILDIILHGKPEDSIAATNLLQSIMEDNHNKGADLESVKTFDVSGGVEVTPITMKHEVKVDKAMALWAQAACGQIVNKNRIEAVAAAKKIVRDWVQAGRNEAGITEAQDTQETKEDEFSVENVTCSASKTLNQILRRIVAHMFPDERGMTGCMAYIDFWITELPGFDELDKNSGIIPTVWIEKIRQSINRIYSCMDEYLQQVVHEDQSDHDINSENTVTIEITNEELQARAEEIYSGDILEEDIYTISATDTAETEVEEIATVDGAVISKADMDSEDSDLGMFGDDTDDEVVPQHAPVQKLKRDCTMHKVNLIGFVHIITGYNKEDEIYTMIRGMTCMALNYTSNSKAKSAAKDGTLKDMKLGLTSAISTLEDLHKILQEKREGFAAKLKEYAVWQRANYSMVLSTSAWAFIGYMMNTYHDRGEGISELINILTDPERDKKKMPCLEEKLKIIISGKYESHAVLDKGNIWWPEKKTILKFIDAIGEEEWSLIEIEMRGNIAIHVYRESDIPNRHGHCNSNPYIPDVLRIKLGMPLLKDVRRKTGASKRLGALT